MTNTYLLSRKANAGANDISYLKLIKYIYFARIKCDSGSQARMTEGVREDDRTE